MSVENFIRAMPKADLGVQLEGAVSKQTLQLIAGQNDLTSVKGFGDILKLLDRPNFEKLPDLITTISGWVKYPDDLSRMVYDVGVSLAKQNVHYAEIGVNPLLYMNHTNITFEQFADALNDGRDKAQRGWKIRLQFVLNLPREDPRRGDDLARWASSATGRKNGIVALGLTGREELQPAAQFERAFRAAEKKFTPRIVHAGDKLAAEGMLDALKVLQPTRIIGGWGAADAPDVINMLVDTNVTLDVTMARQLCYGRIQTYKDYPLRHLFDQDVKLTITSHMPMFYKTTLNDEYMALVEHQGFGLDEIQEIALNAVRFSLLPNDEKSELFKQFTDSYAQLMAEELQA